MAERLVVIGGDAAGMSAASVARRRKDAGQLEIVAVERGSFTSYSACGIPYLVEGVVDDVDRLVSRTPEEFRRDHDIDVRVRHEAVDIDLDRRSVLVRDLDGGGETREGFDHLMVATGAVPVHPDLPGSAAEGIHGVQVLGDGLAILDALAERRPRRVVVVGGGYVGLEMAEAFTHLGLEVAMVDKAPEPMTTLDADMGRLVADAMRGMGIAVHTGEGVSGFEESGGRVSAVVTEHRRLPADLVVLGIGVRPASDLARQAGIGIGPTGGIAVDRRMRTDAQGVWAAGDCAEKFHRVSRRPVAIALGTHANKQGRVAGTNITGDYATFPGVVGTAAAKICDLEIARTGLNRAEAAAAGFEAVEAAVDSTTRAGYFPGTEAIRTKVVAERRTGRLLGAQIVGRQGAAKRIDVLAAALWAEMTVDEVAGLDLAYAPPFAPVWDPVLIAARKAAERAPERSPGDG